MQGNVLKKVASVDQVFDDDRFQERAIFNERCNDRQGRAAGIGAPEREMFKKLEKDGQWIVDGLFQSPHLILVSPSSDNLERLQRIHTAEQVEFGKVF